MYPKIIVILIIIINYKTILCDDTSCNDSQSKSQNLKLKKHLFCDYDPKVQPKTSVHTTTDVRVTLFPLIINLNEMSNTIDFHTWFHMAWKDEHLTWKPSDFGEIETFHTNSGDIWIPEISIFNIGAGGSNTDGDYTCHVRYNGTISCLSVRVFTSRCQTDFTNWPYDKHNCTLHFGSWMYFANELKFEFNDNSLQMTEFIEHQEWNIEISNTTSQAEIYNTEEDAMFFVRIDLQRHSARAIIVYLTPAVVLMVLTLTVLWLDSSSIDRIAVACVNFICHILCIFDLHWYLPTTGAVNSPKILTFYEISITLATFTLIFTCLLRKIHEININSPNWIKSTILFIINCPIGKLINIPIKKQNGIIEDNDEIEQVTTTTTTIKDPIWQQLAYILEWFSFIIIFIIYFIMIIIIFPKSPGPLN